MHTPEVQPQILYIPFSDMERTQHQSPLIIKQFSVACIFIKVENLGEIMT